MLAVVLLAAVLGVSTPVPDADGPTADGVQPGPVDPVVWRTASQAVVDGALVSIDRTGPIVVGRTSVDPRSGAIPVGPDAAGWAVVRLQRHLRDLGVYRGELDGVYGREVAASVVAFHKVMGVERSDTWLSDDWNTPITLDHGAILARNPEEADRVEVDLARQVLFVIRDGDVAAIVPVSSGNGARYWSKNGGPGGGYVRATTPQGDFTLFRHVPGWRVNYLGGLYKPWYFTPYYAVHGSKQVPAHPASHGCVRIPTWEADHLDDFLEIGLPVHIWEA